MDALRLFTGNDLSQIIKENIKHEKVNILKSYRTREHTNTVKDDAQHTGKIIFPVK
jgi:hypothetical protein